MPLEELRAATVHPSTESPPLGAEPTHPAIAAVSEEGPSTSGDVVVAAEAAAEDAPTSEVGGGASPTPGATFASSASAEPAGGRRNEAIPSRASLLNHGRMAERLLVGVCMPEFQAEFSRLDASTILQDAFAAHLWAVNSLSALRDIALWSDSAHQETSAALAQVEKAEGALEAARGEAEEAKRTLRAFQEEVEEIGR